MEEKERTKSKDRTWITWKMHNNEVITYTSANMHEKIPRNNLN